MDAIYQDNGTGQLTGKQLKDLAALIPDDAKIEALTATNTQRDGWVWQIRAKAPAVAPTRPHTPLKRGSAAESVGLGRSTGQRADHG
ncbi:hypothetical protein SEA_HUWBERT_99 [Microbacterium phage Huwbert]|nr:hypothetical protein SEA_HUWBERT_99 [Microbacterium phage Huwbert]